MPAAAVIPAPIGYIKVVAVEKLVVVLVAGRCSAVLVRESAWGPGPPAILWARGGRVSNAPPPPHSVTESKLECSKQALQL